MMLLQQVTGYCSVHDDLEPGDVSFLLLVWFVFLFVCVCLFGVCFVLHVVSLPPLLLVLLTLD